MSETARAGLRCPTCGERSEVPARNPSFPFCQEKCKLVDLGRWMDGHYALDPASGRLDVIDPDEAEEVQLDEYGAGRR